MPRFPFVDYEGALALYPDRPFNIRLEFTGWNSSRNCVSDCWWTIENRGGCLLCNWGATGSLGRARPIEYSLTQTLKKLKAKLAKGYKYDFRTQQGRPKNSLAHLPSPFCDIVDVVCEGGVWEALDVNGQMVARVTRDTARDLRNKLGV